MESEDGKIDFTDVNKIGKIISTEGAQAETPTQGECLGALLTLKKLSFLLNFF